MKWYTWFEHLFVFVFFLAIEVVLLDSPFWPGVAGALIGVVIYRIVGWVMRRIDRFTKKV